MIRRLTLLSMVALVGCNNDPGPLTPTEFCAKYAQDVCDGVMPACLVTEATCTAGQVTACTRQAAGNAGRQFIPANAETCLGKVIAVYSKVKQGVPAGARAYKDMVQACNDVYRGTLAANAPCPSGVTADCMDGLVCDKGFCGLAKPVVQGGCANSGETCSQGYYCSNASGAYFCTSKVGLGAGCGDALPCLENLRCSVEGICNTQLGIGDVCSVDQDCDPATTDSTDSAGFCDPFAAKCAQDLRFKSEACNAMSGTAPATAGAATLPR
jgi:hypothetical protein